MSLEPSIPGAKSNLSHFVGLGEKIKEKKRKGFLFSVSLFVYP